MENLTTSDPTTEVLTDAHALRLSINHALETTPVVDMHTHLFAPQFNRLNLWGIDELLTYHYLIAETFRYAPETVPEDFWRLSREAQADLIWRTLFVEHTPLSEATRGVVSVLTTLGLDARSGDLSEARAFYRTQDGEEYLSRVMTQAGVGDIVMTNDPFDAEEADIWESAPNVDARFHAALRIDTLLNQWPATVEKLNARGYAVTSDLSGKSVRELRRFLSRWIGLMKPLYLAASLGDDFSYPDETMRSRILRDVLLPACREHDAPLSLMIGVRRGLNPALRVAGDGMGRADVAAVANLCAENSEVKFLASLLSRENQHELCVVARKFSNLLPFGCWWFLNNPSIVTEVTQERLELLGTSFIAQHSDARVLDQLLYKWAHTRRTIAEVLTNQYTQLLSAGRPVTRAELQRDIRDLLSDNFKRWVKMK